jgi:hypothetical protein
MKKHFILLLLVVLFSIKLKAQSDTLLFEDFNIDPTAAYELSPNGNDTVWVNVDDDGQPSVSVPGNRAPNWEWSNVGFATDDSTGCIISNSWFDSPANAANYLITPPIPIVDGNAVLNFKSAPYQTPLYLDGYVVLVSTQGNLPIEFTDTLFVAGEYISRQNAQAGGNYSLYTFSPGFVHGQDGTYIEYNNDSSRFLGMLRPFSVSLSAYAGQTIYIAFLHNSFDDNLISLDDILVTGTAPTGVQDLNQLRATTVYPVPAVDFLEISYQLPALSEVRLVVRDQLGRVVLSEPRGYQMQGQQKSRLNIQSLAKGNYTLQIIAGNKMNVQKFNKQ